MASFRERVLSGEVVAGTWLVLASSLCAEMAGRAGFDWAVIDLEHGMGDMDSLLHQLQALDATAGRAIVRVAWNDPVRVKRILDLGSAGIMFPYVSTADEAEAAVRAMRYPPEGIRGMTPLGRYADFGATFPEYAAAVNDQLLTIVQVETADAVRNAEAIAAVPGVDVLFVGPMDLSLGLGVFRQFDHPTFREACASVVSACRRASKAAGILLLDPGQIEPTVADGFTFLAVSSDGGELAAAMRRLTAPFEQYRRPAPDGG